MLRSAKPRNQLVTKPCRSCRLVDVVKGQWMNNIPHIIPHILIRRVIIEECVLHGGSSALETIWMVKKNVQGFDKKVWPLCDSLTGSPSESQTTSHQSWSKVRHLWSCLDRLGVQARLSDWNMDLRFFSLQHNQKATSKLFTQNSRNSPMSSLSV